MDMSDVLLQAALVTSGIVFYLILKRSPAKKSGYNQPSWNYPIKLLCARYIVRGWKKRLRNNSSLPDLNPRLDLTSASGYDSLNLRASAPDGTTILLVLRKVCGTRLLGEITVYVQLPDGVTYKLARHPDTAVCKWDSEQNVWKAGGLKVEVLEPWRRIRVLFNGMLIRTDTNTVHHARINILWIGASKVVSHPEDWNNSLAAQALATELWRNEWTGLLDKYGEGGRIQWSSVQGWFEVDEAAGTPGLKTWLRARGVYDRSWSSQGYEGLRRSMSLMVTAKDGTAIHLRALSYKDVMTQLFFGTVRLPNTDVQTVKSTDLSLEDFCESKDFVPAKYTINITTDNHTVKILLDIAREGGRLLSGIPYKHEVIYRTVQAEVNGSVAAGILELGYEPSEIKEPTAKITPTPLLRWISPEDVDEVGFCAEFDSPAAKCTNYVGGKGASLALLSSKQKAEGYKVPPGFCLTTKSFEKLLEENPGIETAIRDIEASNENYVEHIFREKCDRTVELIKGAGIKGNLKVSILEHLQSLRKRAIEEKVADDIRFAVRSSAVGEDSEALSAAGQNETVLGCVSDDDVLSAVLKCWGSMFAFTSAHYRRQNGQTCLGGAGVVIQVLVSPRTAGVLFTRHPQNGDQSRILITANYGLGESVVSGTVEPDTFIISRDLEDRISIKSIELGSKKQYIVTNEKGIEAKDVTEEDRGNACLSNEEALKLAKLAIVQEELWGAPRDIEWAINTDGIYLLQARPITSLEMWSEEELLHELDYPIMSEEDLVTFANTGEVMPKPVSPLGYSLTLQSLIIGMSNIFGDSFNFFDGGVGITHYRGMLNMYTGLYRRMPKKLDMTVRMMEMSIHGHTIADDRIHSIAINRRPPTFVSQMSGIWLMLKTLILSKWYVKKATKCAKNIIVDKLDLDNVTDLLTEIEKACKDFEWVSYSHIGTSSASSVSQIVAMSILLEKAQEFTNEHCNDLGVMLSCGDAVSAEMPAILKRLAHAVNTSNLGDEFKKLSPENGMTWLKDNMADVYKEALGFLEKYGHRAIMEFDIATVPWAIDPTGFIAVLQNMHTTTDNKSTAASMTDEEIIASLVTPSKPSTRKILRWLLPLCRSMVSKREATKAQLILAVHKVRLAVRRVGKLMVQEWMIPYLELVFYFTITELWNYLETRDPALLKKAMQRRQFYSKWEKIKFAEMQEGWPEPIKIEGPRLLADGAKLQATPACGGDVIARACVIQDLSEIQQLKHGDILITHSTDIGWSPYFPLIAGIVTELGGLISHGAVIARECGLPCIVGATGATNIFTTGDLVRLSGSTGLLEKVKSDADEKKPNEEAVLSNGNSVH